MRLAEAGDPQVSALVAEFGAVRVNLIRGDLSGRTWGEGAEMSMRQIDSAAELEQAERQGIRFVSQETMSGRPSSLVWSDVLHSWIVEVFRSACGSEEKCR